MNRVLLILLVLFTSFNGASAQTFKIRAREHFDTTVIQFDGHQENYNGIGPMFDLWFEEPFGTSTGLTVGLTLLDNVSSDPDPKAGDQAQLQTVGLTTKFFPLDLLGGYYLRAALTSNRLITEGTYSDFEGYGFYGGMGWEFDINQIGLAFEAAWHTIVFNEETTLETFTPAIGVHFYQFF